MFVLIALLLGCSDAGQSSIGKAGTGPIKFDLDGCIELSQRVVDFGETEPGDTVEPVVIQLEDECGIADLLDWELDDPDDAFEVNFDGSDTIVVELVAEEPGEWEAQWRSVLTEENGLSDEFQGTVDLQLFATRLSPSE